MKKVLAVLLCLAIVPALADQGAPVYQSIAPNNPPSGACVGSRTQIDSVSGYIYGCIAGTWTRLTKITSGTSLLKGDGSGGFANAIAGTDFAPRTPSNVDLLRADGNGGFQSMASASCVTGVMLGINANGTPQCSTALPIGGPLGYISPDVEYDLNIYKGGKLLLQSDFASSSVPTPDASQMITLRKRRWNGTSEDFKEAKLGVGDAGDVEHTPSLDVTVGGTVVARFSAPMTGWLGGIIANDFSCSTGQCIEGDDMSGFNAAVAGMVPSKTGTTALTWVKPIVNPTPSATLPACTTTVVGSMAIKRPASGPDEMHVCLRNSAGTFGWSMFALAVQ